MHKLLLAAALTATTTLAAVGPAPANAQTTFSEARVIKSFNIDVLRAVVRELGGTVEEKSGGGYQITFDNGTVASAYFTACSSGECLGTHLQGSFGKPSDKSIAETEKLVNDFNKNNRTIKVWNMGEGRSMADHYIIADGGITMENYRRQLSLYAYMLKRFRKAIYTNG